MATALHELARPLGNPIRWRTWDVFGGTQPGRGHKIQGHFRKRVAEKVSRSARSAFCFGRMTIGGGASGAGRRAFVSPEVSSRRHTPCHDRLAPPDGSGYLPWDHGDSLITGTPCWRLPCNVKGSSRERDPSSVRPGRLTQEQKHAAAPLRAVDFRLALGNVDGRGIGGTMMKWLR